MNGQSNQCSLAWTLYPNAAEIRFTICLLYRGLNIWCLDFEPAERIERNRLDPGLINARAIAHFDVGRLDEANILQRIVYDDRHDWPASYLNLLQTAATIVPFSQSEQMLRGLHREAP